MEPVTAVKTPGRTVAVDDVEATAATSAALRTVAREAAWVIATACTLTLPLDVMEPPTDAATMLAPFAPTVAVALPAVTEPPSAPPLASVSPSANASTTLSTTTLSAEAIVPSTRAAVVPAVVAVALLTPTPTTSDSVTERESPFAC
jgi:hypothetical protein